MQNHYPILLDLTGKRCLVVGGGKVAARKIESLLMAGARVTVISPEAGPDVARWAAEGKLTWVQERYKQQPVSGYSLVVAATSSAEVNLAVYEAVKAADGWINITDRPDLCNYIVPSVIRRGKLIISVSTSGASPSLAKRLKRRFEQEIGPEYEDYLDFLAEIRQQVLQKVSDSQKRKKIFQQLLDDRFITATAEQRNEMVEHLMRQTAQGMARRNR